MCLITAFSVHYTCMGHSLAHSGNIDCILDSLNHKASSVKLLHLAQKLGHGHRLVLIYKQV